MNLRPFNRMARWARNPPSEQRVILWAVVIAIALALAGIERFIGWPDALTLGGDKPAAGAAKGAGAGVEP